MTNNKITDFFAHIKRTLSSPIPKTPALFTPRNRKIRLSLPVVNNNNITTAEISGLDLLLYTLADIKLKTSLLDFSVREFSEENIFIWDRIQLYKTTKSQIRRGNIARKIDIDFILPSAKMPINIKTELKDRISWKIFNAEFEDNLFYEVENEISQCLMDIFTRYLASDDYVVQDLQNTKQRKKPANVTWLQGIMKSK